MYHRTKLIKRTVLDPDPFCRSLLSLELPLPALFLAGKEFIQYRRAKGTRQSVLPDFFIGARAAVIQSAILTRDTSRYRTYFPTVEVIAPDLA